MNSQNSHRVEWLMREFERVFLPKEIMEVRTLTRPSEVNETTSRIFFGSWPSCRELTPWSSLLAKWSTQSYVAPSLSIWEKELLSGFGRWNKEALSLSPNLSTSLSINSQTLERQLMLRSPLRKAARIFSTESIAEHQLLSREHTFLNAIQSRILAVMWL